MVFVTLVTFSSHCLTDDGVFDIGMGFGSRSDVEFAVNPAHIRDVSVLVVKGWLLVVDLQNGGANEEPLHQLFQMLCPRSCSLLVNALYFSELFFEEHVCCSEEQSDCMPTWF